MSAGRARSIALRTLAWLILGGWIGSWALFALVIARVAFRVLPSPEIAGALVGPVLAVLHGYGAFAGLSLAGLAWLLGRRRILIALPLMLAIACLASELAVTPRLDAIHDLAFGPNGNIEAAARYRQLHGLSMAIFSAVLAGAIALVALHVREETPEAADSP